MKPSNVFLTPHGVKLLDFGLARSVASASQTQEAQEAQEAEEATKSRLTQAGADRKSVV